MGTMETSDTRETMRFRKKYSLALMLFVAGTYIAVTTSASIGEYTYFAGVLLAIFGTSDLIDNGKIGPLNK